MPPPGYVAYGAQNQGAYGGFEEIGGTAKTLDILMKVAIVASVLSLVATVFFHGKAKDFTAGTLATSELNSSYRLLGVIGIISGLVFLGIAVLTMVWMSRMAKNQQLLGRHGTWVPGWAVGGWFLPPCVLYVIPYLMMRDLWKASDPQSGPDWKKNAVGQIVHIWWVLYGLVPILFIGITLGNSGIGRRGQTAQEVAKRIQDNFGMQLVQGVVQIGAAVAFIMLVRQLTARHRQVTNEV